jgi:hypothetical protein
MTTWPREEMEGDVGNEPNKRYTISKKVTPRANPMLSKENLESISMSENTHGSRQWSVTTPFAIQVGALHSFPQP